MFALWIWNILKNTYSLIVKHWKTVLTLALIGASPAITVEILSNIVQLIPGTTTIGQVWGQLETVFVWIWAPIFTTLEITAAIISLYLNIGVIKSWLLLLKDKIPALTIFKETTTKQCIHMIIASILYGLAVFGWLLLLVIPGIIFGIRFMFYKYYVAQGYSASKALKLSRNHTKWKARDLFVMCLGLWFIMMIGFWVVMLLAMVLAWIPILGRIILAAIAIAAFTVYYALVEGSLAQAFLAVDGHANANTTWKQSDSESLTN